MHTSDNRSITDYAVCSDCGQPDILWHCMNGSWSVNTSIILCRDRHYNICSSHYLSYHRFRSVIDDCEKTREIKNEENRGN